MIYSMENFRVFILLWYFSTVLYEIMQIIIITNIIKNYFYNLINRNL